MKVFISADIEGVAGITNWEEADKTHATYPEFREEMTAEVVAACEGAMAAGASEILIKDAHGTGRNIIAARLPECARLVRGWSGHPFCMVQELDESFAALMLIGYHSKAGTEGNPLAHTLSSRVSRLLINGELASECLIHTYAAALRNVPLVFIAGDRGICADVKALNPAIGALAVSEGVGPSTISLAPGRAQRLIREGAEAALKGDRAACRIRLPDSFVLEVEFTDPVSAYRSSWYPGAQHPAPRLVRFEARDYFEVLRAIEFIVLRG
jgi:D-amino peptidase